MRHTNADAEERSNDEVMKSTILQDPCRQQKSTTQQACVKSNRLRSHDSNRATLHETHMCCGSVSLLVSGRERAVWLMHDRLSEHGSALTAKERKCKTRRIR